MKRYNQRGIRCIAAHAFEGKGAFALPGDPILAGLEARQKAVMKSSGASARVKTAHPLKSRLTTSADNFG